MNLVRQIAMAGAVVASSLLLAGPGHAGQGFDDFCQTWMQKLEKREKDNLRSIQLRQEKGSLIGEYTGYGRNVVECQAKGKAVGTLVYHEIRYRKAGATREAALSSRPKPIEAVEVMEIFRYDGKSWKY